MSLQKKCTRAIGLALSFLLVVMPGVVNAASIEVVEAPLPAYPKPGIARKVGAKVIIQGDVTHTGTVESYQFVGDPHQWFMRAAARAFLQTKFSGDIGPDVVVTIEYEFDPDLGKSRIVSITSEQVDVTYPSRVPDSSSGVVNVGTIEVVDAPLPSYDDLKESRVEGHAVIRATLTNTGTVRNYDFVEVSGPELNRSRSSTNRDLSMLRGFDGVVRRTRFGGDVEPNMTVTIKYEWSPQIGGVRIAGITSEQGDVRYYPPPELTLVAIRLPGTDHPFSVPHELLAELQPDGSFRDIRLFDPTKGLVPYVEGDDAIIDQLADSLKSMRFSGTMAQPLSIRVRFGFLRDRGVYLGNVRPLFERGTETDYHRNASIDWSEFEFEKVYPPLPKKELDVTPRVFTLQDLPDTLLSVNLIPMAPEVENSGKQSFVAMGDHEFMDRQCLDIAYEYVRAKHYHETVSENVRILNNLVQQTSDEGSHREFSTGDIDEYCADPAFETTALQRVPDSRSQEWFSRHYSRMCELAGDEGRRMYNPSASNLALKVDTLCIDSNEIRKREYQTCLSSVERSPPRTPGLSGDEFCQCVAHKKGDYFDSRKLKINSSMLMQTTLTARAVCDNARGADQREKQLLR